MRQDYPVDVLQLLLDQYPGAAPITHYRLFTSGFENSNYFLETANGAYVLKIFEGAGMSHDIIRFEIDVMDACFHADIRSPEICRAGNGQLFVTHGGKVAILMAFIAGQNMEKQVISDTLAAQVGAETARMDAALAVFRDGTLTRQGYEFDLKHFMALRSKIDVLPAVYDAAVLNDVFDNFQRIENDFLSCPAGLIHNDIVLHNILADGDNLTGLIDFSDMAFSPYVQNIAVSFAQCFFTYNWQPHQAGLFLKAYRQHRPVSDKETGLLYALTLARLATLVVEMNAWNATLGHDAARAEFVDTHYYCMLKLLAIGEDDFHASL